MAMSSVLDGSPSAFTPIGHLAGDGAAAAAAGCRGRAAQSTQEAGTSEMLALVTTTTTTRDGQYGTRNVLP